MKLTTDEQLLKEAILDEVDNHRYRLYQGTVRRFDSTGSAVYSNGITEDFANRERLALAHRVIARIRKAKAPTTMDIPGIGEVLTKRGLNEVASWFGTAELSRFARSIKRALDLISAGASDNHTALLAHQLAARAWKAVQTLAALGVQTDAAVQMAIDWTSYADKATQHAPANAAAFDATVAALLAVVLEDAAGAAAAHQRAVDAYAPLQALPR